VLLGEGDRRNEMRHRFSLAQRTALGRNRATSMNLGPKIQSPPLKNRHSEVRERSNTSTNTFEMPHLVDTSVDRRRRSQTACMYTTAYSALFNSIGWCSIARGCESVVDATSIGSMTMTTMIHCKSITFLATRHILLVIISLVVVNDYLY
jgi:hypothetical protein